jgi:hypothetical protein
MYPKFHMLFGQEFGDVARQCWNGCIRAGARSPCGDCFAMVVVSLKERSGLLAGTVPLREIAG